MRKEVGWDFFKYNASVLAETVHQLCSCVSWSIWWAGGHPNQDGHMSRHPMPSDRGLTPELLAVAPQSRNQWRCQDWTWLRTRGNRPRKALRQVGYVILPEKKENDMQRLSNICCACCLFHVYFIEDVLGNTFRWCFVLVMWWTRTQQKSVEMSASLVHHHIQKI